MPETVLELTPNRTVVYTGDLFTMDYSVSKTVTGEGRLVEYILLRLPGGSWMSFVPRGDGGYGLVSGIRPAAIAGYIPQKDARIFSGTVGAGLARGDYWFGAAIFKAGSRITLDNWRSQAVYYSEAVVTRL